MFLYKDLIKQYRQWDGKEQNLSQFQRIIDAHKNKTYFHNDLEHFQETLAILSSDAAPEANSLKRTRPISLFLSKFTKRVYSDSYKKLNMLIEKNLNDTDN